MADLNFDSLPLSLSLDPEEQQALERSARQRVIRRIPDETDRQVVLEALGLVEA